MYNVDRVQKKADQLILGLASTKPNWLVISFGFYGVSIACYASPLQAIVGMTVCPSVRHTLALSENDASWDHEIFTDG